MAHAQFNQYTSPGGPSQHPESREDRLKREIAAARYHLGPVRVAQELGIKDVAYVRNLFGATEGGSADFTATVGVGVNAFLRTGPKITWVARLRPDYVWWQKRSAARRLNLTSGIEGLAFFNRLFVGVAARREEQQRLLTPEIPELASGRSDEVQANVEVRLSSAFFSFVNFRDGKESLAERSDDPLVRQISLLDRTERVTRAGLRWRPRTGWIIGLGGERSEVTFDRKAADSSNSGSAPVLEILVDRPRLFFQVDLAARSLQASQGSRFVSFDGLTGSSAFSFRANPDLEIMTYASRNLVYSLAPTYPYLDDRRIGLATSVTLGKRAVSRLFVEAGNNRYIASSPATPRRSDGLTSFGGSIRVRVTSNLVVSMQAIRSRFDSNVPGADRTYSSGGLTATFGSL